MNKRREKGLAHHVVCLNLNNPFNEYEFERLQATCSTWLIEVVAHGYLKVAILASMVNMVFNLKV